ncbi:endogenous retrovirus group K member 25 Pol protein-like protein [Willisornis vidua]|uniref:Endogenous retrovirus group K member 25 Pol protein-like protein n=1 Tax=Willisornis vidua TaxID=1566151 RepID=A0ABQ9DAG8_9PASS|nr:endogenous retrovirus group K member 25 Pol protein-like protein [Willisornis vidua]
MGLLGVGVTPEGDGVAVKLFMLEENLGIDPKIWAESRIRGKMDINPIGVSLYTQKPVKIRQYPIPLEGRKGLSPVIQRLLEDKLIKPCMSPYNTLILPVRKADETYWLVQDLKEVNKVVRIRHPVVPNPYTLLGRIPDGSRWFSVLDLKDAFWTCPLEEGSRDIFAFEWEGNSSTGGQFFLRDFLRHPICLGRLWRKS